MKALASTAVLLLASAIAVSAADAKRSPRLEKLALNAADTTKAKNAVIRLTDLVSGWKGGPTKPDASPPDCPSQNYSAYTITGQSESYFSQGGAQIVSVAGVFPSHAQALGDFGVDARPSTASCEGAAAKRVFGKSAKLLSAKSVAAPKVGDRAVAYQITVKVSGYTFYINVVEFVRDRSVAGITTVNGGGPLGGLATLAALMDERLQSALVA